MDGVVDKIIPLVGAVMAGDDRRPAVDDHPVHVASHHDVPVSVGHRRRVVVGPVPDQRQRTDPAGRLVAGVIGCLGPGQQGISRSRSIRWPMVSEWPLSLASIRSRQRRSRWAFSASKLWKDGTGTRKLRRR